MLVAGCRRWATHGGWTMVALIPDAILFFFASLACNTRKNIMCIEKETKRYKEGIKNQTNKQGIQ
jgi:hypothetical protein